MKNIVLIDLDCTLVESLSTSKKISIDTIIVGSYAQIEVVKNKYDIKNIFSMETINYFYTQCSINLDYEIIRHFRHTELKVEHFLSRVTADINSIQYIYYSALSYWFERFKTNEIDAVLSAGIEFGSTFDSIIYDVAKYYGKKVFIMEVALNNGAKIANQLLDYTNKKYININPVQNGLKVVNIDDFLFNSKVLTSNNKNASLRDFIIKYQHILGGYIGVTFFLSLFGKHKSIHHTFKVNWLIYFKNYIYSKKMIKYYNSLCVEFDESKKYVYYPLHMEPEASTMARTVFSNQLVIIKTISQSLPEGWILYVKEHPHQFTKLNNFSRYFYFTSLEKFKTKRYYNEIAKLNNVKLLNLSVNSKNIIDKSELVATINGTVIIEAIKVNKPVMMFSQATSPFVNIKSIFNVNTLNECKRSLDRIRANNSVDYSDFEELIKNYFYEVSKSKKFDYKKLVENLIIGVENE